MNEPLTEISPDEFATGFDRFVHVDEVTAVAAERDAALALLDQIASALGHPDQDHEDLPDSVEALRLHRDHLEAAARAALGEVIRG